MTFDLDIIKENDIHKATALFGSGPAFIAKIIKPKILLLLNLEKQSID